MTLIASARVTTDVRAIHRCSIQSKPWWHAEDGGHHRVRPLQLDPRQLEAEGQVVQALSDRRGAPAASGALVTLGDGRLAMSTLEIAKLTGKRHDNVLADARKMFDALGLMAPEFSGTIKVPQPNGGHQLSNVFNLPKDLTYTLVSGYSVQMRHRIVVQWMELGEQKPARAPGIHEQARAAQSCAVHLHPPGCWSTPTQPAPDAEAASAPRGLPHPSLLSAPAQPGACRAARQCWPASG